MSTARPLIGCDWHDGADIDACGCPALDGPGAIAYRGLLVKARAEIARLDDKLDDGNRAAAELSAEIRYLTAEVARLTAVPGDVEEVIEAYGDTCYERGHVHAGGEASGRSIDRDAAEMTIRATIARAIAEARRDAVAEFVDGHARRLCEQAGNDRARTGDAVKPATAWRKVARMEFVACETMAYIVHHIRRIDAVPVNYGGHHPQPLAMCGRPVAWDTRIPPTEMCISCRNCRVAMGWPEMMAALELKP